VKYTKRRLNDSTAHGFTNRQNVSVNQLSLLIAPPTEGGVISNPADTDPWVPAPEGRAGMVQAGRRRGRWSHPA
jgi:hypothetical protein